RDVLRARAAHPAGGPVTLASRIAALPVLLRNGVIVFGYNTAIAALLAATGYGDGFWINMVYSQCIGLSGWLMVDGGRRLIWGSRSSGGWIWLLGLVAIAIASIGGNMLAAWMLGHPLHTHDFSTSLVISGVAGLIAVAFFWERARKEAIERLAAEAQLRLLQAQIEPHFLFNTLANLQALIGTDPQRARSMLDHLNGYLRAALSAARQERNTLGDEFALLRGYLEIIAIRMDRRLRYRLELPEALSGAEVPPMLLQPLVENAVKHGLEPKLDGGEITVSASTSNGALTLRITDTGVGIGGAPTAGTGTGIAQVRERLAAMYGGGAALDVAANPPGGVIASLVLPLK
ncbi:MAG TPA: histidine kinase, partial [Steroidobacteraceae bacterium]|nr:histidine kinase [Steroidobacteraceae bacterium]